MRKGAILVVTAMDERTVVLRSRAEALSAGHGRTGTSAIRRSAWAVGSLLCSPRPGRAHNGPAHLLRVHRRALRAEGV
jgi:hypothetical protein